MFDQVKLALKAKKIQAELAKTEIEASGADGKVVVMFNGELKLRDLKIDESLLSPDRRAELERILKDTFTQGLNKAQSVTAEKTQAVMKEMGINIPGM